MEKIIFYKTLLQRGKNIHPADRILYSYLVFKSIVKIEGIFEEEGKTINQDELILQVSLNNWQPLVETNNTQIADTLKITRQKVIQSMKNLIEHGYIRINQKGKKEIYMNAELLSGGFFSLDMIGRINYELLIFHSYLRDKGATFGYCIDTTKEKMAKDLATTPLAITKLLNRLYKEKLAKRLDNGKLAIY